MPSHAYLHALNLITQLGVSSRTKLLHAFGSPQDLWNTSRDDFAMKNIPTRITNAFFEGKRNINVATAWADLQKLNLKTVALTEDTYPILLKEIYLPPILLYYSGNLPKHDRLIALVGTRKPTPYGQRMAETLSQDLVKAGVTTVSGLALGVDKIVHQASLASEGKSIGVLGTSLDRASFFPGANWNLGRKMIDQGGCVMSEYPPGTYGAKFNFPQRNRIIAGLSAATIVVEGSEKSGSLITAEWALNNDREVMAVPGEVGNAQAAGPNKLIQKGAKLITSAAEVLNELGWETTPEAAQRAELTLTDRQKNILSAIGQSRTHINDIIKNSRLETAVVNGELSMLCLEGVVRDEGGGFYRTG